MVIYQPEEKSRGGEYISLNKKKRKKKLGGEVTKDSPGVNYYFLIDPQV